MPTTTNYGWTTPADTDLVKDGASAIRTLGSSADTTVKNLNPGTTAGDIDYYTSSTAKARIAIGTAGQVLKVNAGGTAPEWGAAAGSGFVGVALVKTSTQSVSNGTETAITYTSETYDTDGFHDNSTNTSRLTIPSGKGGKYLFTGCYSFAQNATGVRYLNLKVNNTTNLYLDFENSNSSGYDQFNSFSFVFNLVATDYVEMFAFDGVVFIINSRAAISVVAIRRRQRPSLDLRLRASSAPALWRDGSRLVK